MQFFDPRQAALKHSETIEELSDPLLALAGTLTCGATNIGEKHDEYIGQALLKKMCFVVMQRRGLTDALTADRHFEQEGFVRLLK